MLVEEGFRGPIYTTPATIDLCSAMLRDTGAHRGKRCRSSSTAHHPDEQPVEPLYTMEDAAAAMPQFRPVPYRTPTNSTAN